MVTRQWFVLTVLAAIGCGGGSSSDSALAPVYPAASAAPSAQRPAVAAPAYPDTRKGDVVDDYHGTKVADPYRWLEETDSPDTRAWIEAQNKITFGMLERIGARDKIMQRMTKLYDFERYTSAPYQRGGRSFFMKNDGLQAQDVLYWAASVDAEPKVLLDPNTLSADARTALAGYSISDDGKRMAYGLATAGSDWTEWRVREIETGKDLPDVIKWVKFSTAEWSADGKGFYYGRYPEPTEKTALTGANTDQKLYYHRLGAAQADDTLVFARPEEPKWGYHAEVSDDGRYLLLSVWRGTGEQNLVYYKDLRKKRHPRKDFGFVPLFTSWDGMYSFIDNDGAVLLFQTDKDAPRGRVIAVDVSRSGKPAIRPLIAQSEDALQKVTGVGGRLLAEYLHDAHSRIMVFDLAGKAVSEVELPDLGSTDGFKGTRSDRETFYSFTSFTSPSTIYRYDVATGKSSVHARPKVDVDPSRYEIKQVFYPSKDGTKIPMFLVHKKGLALDGTNPTLLYGYGGFKLPLTPGFSVSKLVWLDMGGVYAMPNLRGGGEYGEEWHQAGTKLKKQTVFDDFIAAAEWLIANRYTRADRLAISGRSNGGLLVGAAMTQRPDLFGAALPGVGVMDMLRFHKFTIGWAWVDDYGSSDNEDEFKALHAYSPLHNIKDGTRYPATLITTGDHDDRVVPGHSFKFAARLQAAHTGDAPVLIRIETRAGHGSGKPLAAKIAEASDELAFLAAVFGIQP